MSTPSTPVPTSDHHQRPDTPGRRRPARRTLLAAGLGAAAAAGAGGWYTAGRGGDTPHIPAPRTRIPDVRPSAAPAAEPGPSPVGTTLLTAAVPEGARGAGYRRIAAGPGRPSTVRAELAAAGSRRADRRTPLAALVHLTDLHVVDAQSPARTEWMNLIGGSAQRPQEALGARSVAALTRRINALAAGPHTGTRLSCAVATGDSTDNQQHNELQWYLALLSGGTVDPNSGDPARFEGAQTSGLDQYWNPDDARVRDRYKRLGYPDGLPGLLDAAIRPFRAPGLRLPWYAVLGNHDNTVTGAIPNSAALERLYTGSRKRLQVGGGEAALMAKYALHDPERAAAGLRELAAGGPARGLRTVTPDDRRRPVTNGEYLMAHLDPRYTGAGPVGHGFTADALAQGRAYYAFPIADGVRGLALDTTNRAGGATGSVGTAQLDWLDAELDRARADGARVLVFSHHPSEGLDNLRPDPSAPHERRHGGAAVLDRLHRTPNVAAWINGHTHRNRIRPHRHRDPNRAFWEITTASHVDWPVQARVLELADNGDGTLSLWTTLIEPEADYAVDYDDRTDAGLAALYREFAWNDPQVDGERKAGGDGDGNTELLLPSRL